MLISLIAAVASNRVIGKDNQMLWRQSTDLKRFKRLTLDHHILMGRKTFESLGSPLPRRIHLLLTRDESYEVEGVEVVHSFEEAIERARERGEEELFVIGGGQVYEQALPMADRIYLTRIIAAPEGDAYFPEFEETEWEVAAEEAHFADERNDYPYIFVDLIRRTSKSAAG